VKALVLKRYGASNPTELAEIDRPAIAPDELLVQVHAAGVNPVDCGIAKGDFKPIMKLKLPATMGSDLAGVVVEVGSRVTRFKVGDAVFASLFDTGAGSFAEYAAVPEYAAALKPANLDFVQAASIPMVGLTSWQALHERARVKPGQKVFIPAGSGGIGSFAIQLARQLGATVATTTSTANVALVRSLGADTVIDYKQQQFEDTLSGYDVVLGTVKGDGVEKSLRIVKPGSTIISLVGPPDAAFARKRGMSFLMTFVFSLLSRKIIGRARQRHASYSFMFVLPDGGQLEQLAALVENGSIRPVIDRVFPFARAREAMAYLEQGRARGKVVLQMLERE
jgi:NADPH:quinone reductase-like Zn-dependent oxidoreductase